MITALAAPLMLAGSLVALGANPAAAAGSGSATVSVSASPLVSLPGNPVTVSVTVAGSGTLGIPTGSIQLFVNGSPYINTSCSANAKQGVCLDSTGSASVQVSGLPAAVYTVYASYSGDTNYARVAASSNLTLTVSTTPVDNTTTTLSINPLSIAGGASTTLTAQVVDQSAIPVTTGNVTFFNVTTSTLIGTASLDATGTATLVEGGWTAGNYTVQATFVGPVVYGGSGATGSLTVTNAMAVDNTTTTLTISPSSIAATASATLSAQVLDENGVPPTSGSVSFYSEPSNAYLGSVALDSSGDATLLQGGWTPGNYTVDASFVGPTSYGASSSTAALSVISPAPVDNTTTTLTISPSMITAGSSATFGATVVDENGIPVTSGSVTFFDTTANTLLGSVALDGSGAATLVQGGWTAGDNSIEATFVGPTTLGTSGATGDLDVLAAPAATTISVTGVSPNQIVSGEGVTLNATVASLLATPPTGTITFYGDGNVLGTAPLGSGGSATLDYVGIWAPGVHALTASYGGDAIDAASGPSSSTQLTVVTQDTSSTSASATPTSAGIGSPVTLVATVSPGTAASGTPNGLVTFTLASGAGSLLCSATLVGGNASCQSSALPLGSDTIVASYGGDGTHESSSASFAETIGPAASTTTVTSTPSSATVGSSISLTAAVASASSLAGNPTGAITFTLGTTVLCNGALVSGAATCSTTMLPVGADNVAASYGGDQTHLGSASSTTVIIQPIAITITVSGSQRFGSTSPTFTFLSSSPSGIAIGGALVCRTVDAGRAINGTLPDGSYTIDGSSCSGLIASSSDYTINYVGAINGFAVTSACSVTGALTLPSGTSGGLTTTRNGNVDVPQGQAFFVNGGTLNGNLSLENGAILLMNGGTINGNVTLVSGDSATIIGGTIKGNLQSDGASLAIASVSVRGNLQLRGGSFLDNSASIGGNLQIDAASWFAVCGGTIGGNLQADSATSVPPSGISLANPAENYLCNATVGGNLQVQNPRPGAPVEIGKGTDCGAALTVRGNSKTTAVPFSPSSSIGSIALPPTSSRGSDTFRSDGTERD